MTVFSTILEYGWIEILQLYLLSKICQVKGAVLQCTSTQLWKTGAVVTVTFLNEWYVKACKGCKRQIHVFPNAKNKAKQSKTKKPTTWTLYQFKKNE